MKTSIENTLVTFHTSGGGGNRNKCSFCEFGKEINAYTDDLFLSYSNHYDIIKRFKDYPNISDAIFKAMDSEDFSPLLRIGLTEESFGKAEWFSCGGSPVGLAQENDGTGTIDLDGSYDTTTVMRLSECSEREFQIILNSQNSTYISSEIIDYCKKELGIEEE